MRFRRKLRGRWPIASSTRTEEFRGSFSDTGDSVIDFTQGIKTGGASTFLGTITVGVDDTGYDVKFFGATSGKYWLWDESANKMIVLGDSQFTGDVTVGVDDTGHDVKFFGATSGAYWLWDESANGVVQIGTLTIGADDAGHDVKFFGATSGAYWLWDESVDGVRIVGASATWNLGSHANADGSGYSVANGSAAVRVYSDEGSADNSGNNRGFLARHLTATAQTGNQTRSAAQLQVKIVDANVSGNSHWQGAYNYVEVDGTVVFGDGTNAAYLAGARSALEFASGATITLSANAYASAFRAELNDAATATLTGVLGAYMVATPTAGNWGNAFVFESAGANYPCGVKAVTAAPTGNTSHALKVDIGGTSGYIPVYDDENFNASD